MQRLLVALAVIAGALFCTCAAQAGSTEVGVAVVVVHGKHTERYSAAGAGAIPAPFIYVAHSMGRFEISAEGIPPLGRLPVASNGLGLSGIELSYAGASLRYRAGASTTVGIGETIYNQQTTYDFPYAKGNFPGVSLVSSQETDRSRVAGLQYQVLQTLHRTVRSKLVLRLGYNPRMTAALGQVNRLSWSDGSSATTPWRIIPERGSQIETMLSSKVQSKKGAVEYGVRYLNLQMFFPDGTLADRNAFLIPFIGFSSTLGRP